MAATPSVVATTAMNSVLKFNFFKEDDFYDSRTTNVRGEEVSHGERERERERERESVCVCG